MNKGDMKISFIGRELTVYYRRGEVLSCELDDASKLITFHLKNRKDIVHNITDYVVPECVYLSQFGVSVTESGEFFFIQSWEKGLFCFNMQTGALAWHQKIKKAYNLIILEDAVICRFYSQGLLRMDMRSGEVQKRIPLREESEFWALNDMCYLIGPKRGKYQIIDNEFSLLASIPCQQMNPGCYDTFLIMDAACVPDGIQISGFEYSGNTRNVNEYRFCRLIDVGGLIATGQKTD